MSSLRIDEGADGVVVVTIDRPQARNAFTFEVLGELTDVATALRRRTDVKAVILTGGADYFSAGQDLKASAANAAAKPTLLERRVAQQAGPDMCRAWQEIEVVTIAAIEGYCIGGAAALALVCDFRIMGEGASLRLPEAPLGMSMPWGTLPRLAAMIGAPRAKRMALFGETIDAETCLAWGAAEELTAKGEALTVARRWAAKAAVLPPLPARIIKQAIDEAVGRVEASGADRDQYLLTTLTADLQEGLAAFREKRKADFKGE
ncbi:MAG: enoyl-CoA hydratase [Caulobacter sp.]|nr:enoyl-CoA hydratase [Caulobacter sp.]